MDPEKGRTGRVVAAIAGAGAVLLLLYEFGTQDQGEAWILASTGVPTRQGVARLVRVGRDGLSTPLAPDGVDVRAPRISPDGVSVLFHSQEPGRSTDIWHLDLESEALRRLTRSPKSDAVPVWSRDGLEFVFTSSRNGRPGLFREALDGTGEARRLPASDAFQMPSDWSRDGRYVVAQEHVAERNWDLVVFDLEKESTKTILATPAREMHGVLSPNGRWLAHESDATGRPEVYIRPFPRRPGEWQISFEGGEAPIWSRDGTEIYYRGGDGSVRAVSVDPSEFSVRIGSSRVLFEDRFVRSGGRAWDLMPDGAFLMLEPLGSQLRDP